MCLRFPASKNIYSSSFHPLYFYCKRRTVHISITQNGGFNVCHSLADQHSPFLRRQQVLLHCWGEISA